MAVIAAPAGVALGVAPAGVSLPSRTLVEASAQAVEDFIGWHAPVEGWRYSGAGTAGIHRVRSVDSWFVLVSGGTVAVEHKVARPYESHDEWRDTWDSRNARRQAEIWGEPEAVEEHAPRVITEWSRKSRSRLSRSMAEIDHDTWKGVGGLAMLTLTLPDNWLDLAPTGAVFKRHLDAFRKAWQRNVGPWSVVWKLEFQGRGAPHAHILLRLPYKTRHGEDLSAWCLRTWADICHDGKPLGEDYRLHRAKGVHLDRSRNFTDPARIAKYFLGHSSKKLDGKEYQHRVPKEWREPGKGPGRFWGIAGLDRLSIRVEIDPDTFWKVRRILRGVHRGRRASVALSRRAHAVEGLSDATRRASLGRLADFGHGKDRILRSSGGGGWVIAQDAPGLAADLAHFLASALLAREGP